MDFKKILEGVVGIINTTEKSDIGFANICTYIGENCPELMEVGDEKVRRAIITTIHLYYGEPLEDEAKEMISWIEKQGEHQKFRDSIQVGDKVTRNKDGILVNLSQLDRVAKQGKKGTNGNEREIPNLEQKPAWSEEDEKIYSRIYDLIHNAAYANYDVDEDGKELGEYAKITDWLKSIKDRVQSQPKQEWSKEDEYVYNEILKRVAGKKLYEHDLEYIYKWLKSLKSQTTWKPSEGQMKQLGWIAEQNKDNMIGKELMSLYQELLKLREE